MALPELISTSHCLVFHYLLKVSYRVLQEVFYEHTITIFMGFSDVDRIHDPQPLLPF